MMQATGPSQTSRHPFSLNSSGVDRASRRAEYQPLGYFPVKN